MRTLPGAVLPAAEQGQCLDGASPRSVENSGPPSAASSPWLKKPEKADSATASALDWHADAQAGAALRQTQAHIA